jgi:hypothetical protein
MGYQYVEMAQNWGGGEVAGALKRGGGRRIF